MDKFNNEHVGNIKKDSLNKDNSSTYNEYDLDFEEPKNIKKKKKDEESLEDVYPCDGRR